MSETRLLPAPPSSSGTAGGSPAPGGQAAGPPAAAPIPVAPPGIAPSTPSAAPSTPPAGAPRPGPAPIPAPQADRSTRSCRLHAFASGKGGVGKSLLVANLGIQLARQGRSVTLLDGDLPNANLHSYVGIAPSQACLDDLLSGRSASLAALARDTHVPGLRLISGSRGGARAIPAGEELESLVLKAYELPSDCLLIDLPSGRHPLSLDLLEMADCGILVTTPEPSSLEGAFRLVEELGRRALDRPDAEARRAAEAALGPGALAKGPAAFLDSLADVDPGLASRLGERLARLRLVFVINQSRSEGEAQAALSLRSLCRHYLGVELEFGGAVEFDLSAWQATRQRKSLSQKYPNAPATRTIEQIATSLLNRSTPLTLPRPGWVRLADRTLYEMLEVPPSASQRDLQRAYDRLQAIASAEAEALGGSVHPDRVHAVGARVEAAYRTLVFLESRSEYDRSLVAANRVRPEELRDLRLEPAMTATPSQAARASAGSHASPAAAGSGKNPHARARGPASAAGGAAAGIPHDSAAAEHAPEAAGVPDAPGSAPPAGAGAASPEGAPTQRVARPRAVSSPLPGDATPAPEVMPLGSSGTPLVYSGPVLAALRHERGLSLEAIGAVTKVRTSHLRLVEEERFAELPAPIFLKGFVREYARCLSLDPVKVWQDYQARYEEWKRGRSGS